MKGKAVIPRELANRDVDEALAHYVNEAPVDVALGFIDALELVSDKSTKAPGSPEGKIAGRVRDVAQGKGVIIRDVRDMM